MRKLIRNTLLIILLVAFLVIPAYSEPSKVEHPIIVMAAGAPMEEYIFMIQLFERAEVKADVLYDIHTQYLPALFGNFSVVEEIESGKYKTAIFVFGPIGRYYGDSFYLQTVNIREVIENLKYKIDFCKENGVRMIGLQCYFSIKNNDSKENTIRIIEEILPHMDSLIALYNFGDFPELGDKFIEVGKAKGIPIEYFTESGIPFTSYSEVIPILSMKFGE